MYVLILLDILTKICFTFYIIQLIDLSLFNIFHWLFNYNVFFYSEITCIFFWNFFVVSFLLFTLNPSVIHFDMPLSLMVKVNVTWEFPSHPLSCHHSLNKFIPLAMTCKELLSYALMLRVLGSALWLSSLFFSSVFYYLYQ